MRISRLALGGLLIAGNAAGQAMKPPSYPTVTAAVIEAAASDGVAHSRDLTQRDARQLIVDPTGFTDLAYLTNSLLSEVATVVSAQHGKVASRFDVNECPERAPCHIRGDGILLHISNVDRDGVGVAVLLHKSYNVKGDEHPEGVSVTYRIVVERTPTGGWIVTSVKLLYQS